LRAKYKWLKEQWRKYRDRANTGSGKAAKDEPECFHIIDPIFFETLIELKVVTKAADILESDKGSDGDECIEEDESDGILVQSTISISTY